MGKCKQRRYAEPKRSSDDCVRNMVMRIIKAQDEVEENCCTSSCESSIKQLRKSRNALSSQHTTIPFILYCGKTCKPFLGSGVFQASMRKNRRSFFGVVETPIFRAKHFGKGNDSCVKLELLLPITEQCDILMPKIEGCSGSISDFFPTDDPVIDFQATGICMTVDLEQFLGITCLDPITPIPANESHSSHTSC